MTRRGHRHRPYRLNGIELLKALRTAACRKQLGRCYWCNCILRTDVEPTHPQFCTADHLIPLHAGSKTVAGNIVAACRVCNNGRHPELNRTRARRGHLPPAMIGRAHHSRYSKTREETWIIIAPTG